MKITYQTALQDARVQYAIATGQIDNTIFSEVVNFLENTMKKAAHKNIVPENGYVIVNNGYAYFSRKVKDGFEHSKETDLENVLDLIDQGLLKKYSTDRQRGATYYVPELATLTEMGSLLEETTGRLTGAMTEYEERLGKHTETFSMPESVNHLTRRVKTQQATIAIIKSHS